MLYGQRSKQRAPLGAPFSLQKVSGVSHDAWNGRPPPYQDSGWKDSDTAWMRDPRVRFGFSSEEQEQRWFRGTEREKMRAEGLRLSIYEVPDGDVRTLGSQCMFVHPEIQV
jgi:hypothetical protein